MALVPKKITDKIAFYSSRLSGWQTNATAMGTTALAVTDLQTKTAAAQAALAAQLAAHNAAKTATDELNTAVRAMARAGADIIFQVRAQAGKTGDAAWALAQLPVPAVPGPTPPPGQPYGFKVALDGNGSVIITWKANNLGAGGTTYRIYRTIAGGEQTYIAGSGQKKYIDPTIPAGVTHVTYDIQGVRSTAAGMWGTFVVRFGSNASGQATASIAEVGPKLAA